MHGKIKIKLLSFSFLGKLGMKEVVGKKDNYRILLNVFFLLFILTSSLIIFYLTPSAELTSDKKTDSLLMSAEKSMERLNHPESILISRKAFLRSSEISYTDGIVRSKYWIAFGLCNMAKYDKSLLFIKDIEKNYGDYIKKNYKLKIRITDLKGRNYLALGLRKQAAEEFRKELSIANDYKDPEMALERKGHTYGQLAAVYEGNSIQTSNRDSLYYYLNKAKSILESNAYSLDNDKMVSKLSLADYHIHFTKNLDSALYYNTSALDFVSTNKSNFIHDVLLQRAKILNKENRYDESLEYCFRALTVVKKLKQIECEKTIYDLMAQNYNQLEIRDKELYYILQGNKTREILAHTIASGTQISTDSIYEELKQNKDKSNRILITGSILGFFTLFSITGVILIITKKRIVYKRFIIKEKEKELENLRDNKLTDAKNELIVLAKENAPEFLTKFKEVYSELYLHLLEIQPNLKNSELLFCAYLKLNFKTKEIATYLYVTPRAVEIRKNRLRKKFNISSEQDLYVWINNLTE